MKAKIKIPEFFELSYGEGMLKAYFDYDEGEEQWFDARAGVGHPGSPADVIITSVDFGGGKEDPETFPQLDIERCEVEIMEEIDKLYDAYWSDYAEHMEGEK